MQKINLIQSIDPNLQERIQDYLHQNSGNSIYTSDVIEYLTEKYPRDYRRRSDFAMKNAVEKSIS